MVTTISPWQSKLSNCYKFSINDCNKLKFCWVCKRRRECLYFSCEWIKAFTSIILSFKEQNHNRDVHKRQFSFWYVCRVVVSAYFVSWICQSHNSYLLGIHPISGLCVLIGQSKTLAYSLLGDPPHKWFVYMLFHFRFLFLNQMEYYRASTSLQLEYYRASTSL